MTVDTLIKSCVKAILSCLAVFLLGTGQHKVYLKCYFSMRFFVYKQPGPMFGVSRYLELKKYLEISQLCKQRTE